MRPVRTASVCAAIVTILAGVLTAAPAQAGPAPTGPATAGGRCGVATLSVETLSTGCTATSGTVVTPDGRAFALPTPGESVMASSSSAPGAPGLPEVVIANTGTDGVAVRLDDTWTGSAPAVEQERSRTRAASATASAATADTKCTSTANDRTGYRWASTVKWYYNATGQKSTYAEAALRGAADAWTGTISSCGRTVTSTASETYVRRATQAPALTDQGGCTKSNGYSVMGWGKLPKGVLGVTCVWFDGNGVAKEADQRYATGYSWSSTATCSGQRYDTQAVATHEWGHLYGLGHVAAGTGQVMEPSAGPCQLGSRKLGLGDVVGISALY